MVCRSLRVSRRRSQLPGGLGRRTSVLYTSAAKLSTVREDAYVATFMNNSFPLGRNIEKVLEAVDVALFLFRCLVAILYGSRMNFTAVLDPSRMPTGAVDIIGKAQSTIELHRQHIHGHRKGILGKLRRRERLIFHQSSSR